MKKPFKLLLAILITLSGIAGARAADTETGDTARSEISRKLIYCADLMSHEERNAYRAEMRAAGSAQEREQLRAKHREKMQARISERGLASDVCEPTRIRHRLRERGGRNESAD